MFFITIDDRMTGLITSNSLAHSLKLLNTELGELVMRLFDPSSSNSINFENFTIACWNILTIEEASLATFTFHLLDSKGYGKLLQDEMEIIVKAIFELPVEKKSLVIDLFLGLGDDETGAITANTFNSAVNEFPFLLAPIRVMFNRVHSGFADEKRACELFKTRHKKFGNLSLMGIISTMKIKPTAYENLIRTHGIDGSERLIQRTKSGRIVIDLALLHPNEGAGRLRKSYFSPVFLMETTSDNPQRVSQGTSQKLKRNRNPVFNRKQLSAFSKLPIISSFRYPKNRSTKTSGGRQKINPIDTKDENNEKFNSQTKSSDSSRNERKSTEVSGSYDSKKEALKSLQEWSTNRSPQMSNNGGSHSSRERKSQRKSQRLNLSNSKWQDPAVRRQEEQDDQVVQLIEASFWTPGQQWSTKEKNGHDLKDGLRSSSTEVGGSRSGLGSSSHSKLYE